jgi:hypothetical protein
MFLVREVMHCKPGKAGELVRRFKELSALIEEMKVGQPLRVMTDVSGERYWTVVIEQPVESLEQHVQMTRQTMTEPRVQKVMAGYHDFVDNGRREIYKLE